MSLDKLINQVKSQGKDQSVAGGGGGDYTPPEKGATGARLVGYYETGKHEETWEGKTKTVDKVDLVFELIGKKHPPRALEDGTNIPVRMTVTLTVSNFKNAGFFLLFSSLRTDETHFVQLVGKAFLVDIVHREVERNGKKNTYANIDRKTIRKPVILAQADPTDPESELVEKPFPVGPALTPLGAFVWEFADAESWDAIKIDGEYPERKDAEGKVIAEARSKNVLQLKIASALNFKGLPCYDYAASKLSGGTITKEDVGSLADTIGGVDNEAPVDADDPMAGIA